MTDVVGLKDRIKEAEKQAMRAKDMVRLGILRLIQAAVKQSEVDERIVLSDEQVLSLLDKLIRQRKESIKYFEEAKRQDLVDKELFEIGIIQAFLPSPLSQAEIHQMVTEALKESSATTIRDMGKVMAQLKPKLQGRADMAEVGNLVKTLLSS